MNKKIKKIIAVVCAIAMVVSSMTIYSNTTKAADYSTLTYNAITNNNHADLKGTSLEGSKYAFEGESVVINPFQYQDAGMKQLYMAFPGNWADGLKAVVNGTEIAGSVNQIFINSAHEKFTYEYNVIEISSNAGTAKIIIYCPNNAGNGTYEGGSGENPSTETTTSEPKPQTPAQKINTDDNLVKTTSTVVASSNAGDGYNTAKVHDRSVRTRWAAGQVNNNSAAGEWIYVDLGKTYNVSSVASVWNNRPSGGYQIYYATDLTGDTTTRGVVDTKVWTAATEPIAATVYNDNLAESDYIGQEDILTNVVARYIMFYATTSVTDNIYGVSIFEIGVFGTEVVQPDPVMNVKATGGTKKIDVTWDLPTGVKEGTKYYVYLDDSETESAIVDTNSATLTDVAAGQHIVKVKAYYDGVFSTVAVSPQTTVYGEPTAVTQLAVVSQKANTVQVQWHYEPNATYKIELVNAAGETVDTITDTTVDGTLGKCEFTNVAKGTYTVKATAIYGETSMDAVVSNEITVEDVQPVNIATLDCVVETVEQIGLTWTVNNETEGQTYKVYLDDKEVATLPAKTYAYTLENVKPGAHVVKVTSVYGEYETEGLTRSVIVKAAPVTKFDTELTQVDATAGVKNLDDTWSYEFANQSADSFIGISADGALVAYLPTYVNAAVDRIYENVTGLEVGKTYTYTYTISTDVSGNNIPVIVSMDGGYSDNYELKEISAESGVTVTKKFTATATTMKLDYILGWINNSASVKISKAVIEELQPTEVSNLKAEGGIEGMNLSWESEGAVEEQAYNIYLNGSATPVATGIKEKSYSVTGIQEGTYTVTVKAVLNGVETAGVTVENVEVSKMGAAITSESVMVEGFQIKTNNTTDTVGFRTVCKAPNKGSQIVASDGKTYTVESMGTIYTLDTNYNGYRRNDMLNASYTLLNPTAVSGQSYTYVGANEYDGAQRTFGYVATDEGIAKDWNTSDKDNTYYVRTMNGMSANNMLEYSIHVRAFVVTTDGTIVYGKKTACISVAEVADYLYKNSKSKNFTAHKYLYNSILTKVANTNPYYRDSTLSYGWDSQLFTPANPTFSLTEGTLDALNGKN